MTNPTLENWSLSQDSSNPFLAPELRATSLQGNVYNHPRFEDGSHVHTSSVSFLDMENNIAETRNTTYKLGKMSDTYKKWLELNSIENS